MHINGNRDDCPFDRNPLHVDMDLIQLTFVYSHDGIHEGSIFLAFSDPIMEIISRIIISPTWTRDPDLDNIPVLYVLHNRRPLSMGSRTPIFMSNIKPGDYLYFIFNPIVMENYEIRNKKTNLGMPIILLHTVY